jgi:photosystem II stability/assembly factor-like uncharacterized protein
LPFSLPVSLLTKKYFVFRKKFRFKNKVLNIKNFNTQLLLFSIITFCKKYYFYGNFYKMKKKYLLLILLFPFLCYSQYNDSAPWMEDGDKTKKSSITNEKTIYELKDLFNQYWKNHDKSKKGSGYKPFMRWENHWSNNTNEKGFLITPQEIWKAIAQKKEAKLKNNNSLPTTIWEPLGPFTNTNTGSLSNGQGQVNVVAVDPSNPNTIYIGAPSGGIWKSIDTGANWLPLSDNLPQIGVSGIAIDPTDSNTIYIATGDKDSFSTYSIGVLKSTDGGLSWNTTGLTFDGTSYSSGDIIINPTNPKILFCATNNGIYKSTNGGIIWDQILSGSFSKGSIRFKPGDSDTIYAVNNADFYRSTDGGKTFSTTTTGLTSTRSLLDVTPANPNYIYILTSVGDKFKGIYKSIDGGDNFKKTAETQNIYESNQYYIDLALAVSDSNPEELYVGCLNIWKSNNGGNSFNSINAWNEPNSNSYTHADIHFLKFFNNNLFAGTDGGIYVSSNGGLNFENLTAGLQISQFYKIAVSKQTAGKMMGGLQDNGGFAYNNNKWYNYHGADGMDTAIDPNNSNNFYSFVQNGGMLHISKDAGASANSFVPAPTGETGNWVTPLVFNRSGELFAGYNKLYKLIGKEWRPVSTTSFGTGSIEVIGIDPSNDSNIYVVNEAALYRSTDKGNTFKNIYNADKAITSVCVHSTDSNIIYMTTTNTNGEVLRSKDGGKSFVSISAGLPNIGKNVIKHQDRNVLNPLYLGTKLGVFYKDDSMSQWEPSDTNLPNVSVTDIEFNYEDAKIIAATYGRGVWQSNIVVETFPNDIQLISVQYPNINCNGITPKITVKNNGQNSINNVLINYTYNDSPLVYNWTGTINSLATQIIEMPEIKDDNGAYLLNISTLITNDNNPDNNHATVPLYINDLGTASIVNTFEDINTSNLLTYNDGGTSSLWKKGARTGDALATGANKVYTTGLTGNYPDKTKAYLISQCYDLTKVSNPEISFKSAFDLEPNWDIFYVEYTTDFGKTWAILGQQQGLNWYNSSRTNLSSGSQNDCQNCPGSQWTGTNLTLKTYSYTLKSLAAEKNVIFRIVFWSDDLKNQLGVIIDDFAINGVTLSKKDFELYQIGLYPNPTNGVFNIEMDKTEPKTIEIYDLNGKRVFLKNNFINSGRKTTIDLSNVPSGIYFIKIETEGNTIIKRIIKN